MIRIVDRRGFAFGIKWIAAGATAIGIGVWSYSDQKQYELGIGWRFILAGCIMLPIGIAAAISACRNQPTDQTSIDVPPPAGTPDSNSAEL